MILGDEVLHAWFLGSWSSAQGATGLILDWRICTGRAGDVMVHVLLDFKKRRGVSVYWKVLKHNDLAL